jgi:putative CocE/NonD family hydrolase
VIKTRLFGVGVPMSDGVQLTTDVVLPSEHGRWPAVIIRTPYSRVNDRILGWADMLADFGYAAVTQDVRGRGDSAGQWEPWINEFGDGHDAVEWVAAQDWSDGQVGMLGGSYEGWVQWAAATRRPPHLKAMVTSGSPGRWFRDWPYRWGAFYATDYLEWLNRTSDRVVQPVPFPSWAWAVRHLDLRSLDRDTGRPMERWQHALDHDTYDEYWHSLDIAGYEAIDIPVLHMTGWFDGCAPGQYHHFAQMSRLSPAASRQSLVVGPWDHGGAVVTGLAVGGDLEIGAQGSVGLPQYWLPWFDRWLKSDKAAKELPTVTYFTLGDNHWRTASAWPPSDFRELTLHLHSDGALSEDVGREEGTRNFTYDPRDPVVSLVEVHNRNPLEWAPRPESLIDHRPDVLIYHGTPVVGSLIIAGPARAVLFVSSSAVDTDFVVSLIYVRANGFGTIVADGIVRAALRSSLGEVALLEPGRVYELDVEINDIALQLQPGESLRVAVSSSLSPNYHPNPNTGEGYGGTAAPVIALQTIHHGGHTPSRVILCAGAAGNP